MTHHTEAERPWWRDRTDEIEQQVGMGKMDAMACYTQMVQLLDAERRAPAAPVSKPELEAALDAMDDEVTRMQPGRSVRWIGFTRDDRLRVVAAALAAAPQPPEVGCSVSNRGTLEAPRALQTERGLGRENPASKPVAQGSVLNATLAAPVQMPDAIYKLRVRGVFQDCTPKEGAFGLQDGEYELLTEQQVRQLLAAQERKPLTDTQVFDFSNGTLPEKGHQLIHESDPDYAAMCDMDPGARWILSNVHPENSLAFARAIERAHGIGAPPMGSDGNSTHS